jgi:hypothetical protein
MSTIDVLDVKRLSCERSLEQKAQACGQQSVLRIVRSDRHLGQMSTEARLSSSKASQADDRCGGPTTNSQRLKAAPRLFKTPS